MSCARGAAQLSQQYRQATTLSLEPVAATHEPVSPMLSSCDICGSEDLAELRCKVICRNCRTILQSCADL